MKIFVKIILTVYLACLVFACKPTTQLRKTWTDPSYTKATAKPFKKVLVLAALKEPAFNKIAEDKMSAQVKNATVVQASDYLNATDTDQKAVEEKLKKDGFDGVILMRLKSVLKTSDYKPGTEYMGWYGSRGYVPGVYTEDKTYFVETNIYSLEAGKLFWTATTASVEPKKIESAIDGIISTVKWQLQKKGLIK